MSARGWRSCGLAVAVGLACAADVAAQGAERKPGQTAVDDVSLVGLLELKVVAPSLTAQSASEAAAVVDVITAEQLRDRGYRSLGEALGSLSGLDLPHDHYQYNLGVRGISSGKRGWSRVVKVMLDGQPISFRPSGENFLGIEAIPIGVVERIEVIRGPASALYGANAYLGVVNIVTKRAESVDGALLSGGLQTGPRLRAPFGEAVVAQQFGRFSFVAAAAVESKEESGYRLVPLPGVREPAAAIYSQGRQARSGSAFGRLAYAPDDSSSIVLDGHFQHLEAASEFMDWGPVNHGNFQSLINGYGRLAYEKTWFERLRLSTSVALASGLPTRTDQLRTAANETEAVEREVGYLGTDVRGVLDYRWGERGSVLGGLDYTHDEQDSLAYYGVNSTTGVRLLNPPAGYTPERRAFANLGVFAQAIAYPLERFGGVFRQLGATAGLRFDAHNIYGDVLNGRAGLVYGSDVYYLKLLGGTSFRAPASTQLFSNSIVALSTVGNPALKPERASTVELAVGATVLPQLALRANAFYTHVEDRVDLRAGGSGSSASNDLPVNSSPIDSLGFESQLDLRLRRLSLFANYSHQYSAFDVVQRTSLRDVTVAVATDSYPGDMFKVGATYKIPSAKLLLSAEYRWVSARLGFLFNNQRVNIADYLTERYALAPHGLLDLTISTAGIELSRGRETRLVTKLRNALGASYAQPGYGPFDIPGAERTLAVWVQQEL